MKVSLLNIRFEVTEKSEKYKYLEYTAEGFITARDDRTSKASYASVLKDEPPDISYPPTPADTRELTIEDYRGCRELSDIKIETYNSLDFNIAEINRFLTDHPAFMSEAEFCKPGTEAKAAEDNCASCLDSSELVTSATSSSKVKACHRGSAEDGDPGVRPKSQSPTPAGPFTLHFYSGNPSVEKVKGILHIYKENHLTSLADDTPRSELICMLAVPAKYTIHDLLKFNGPCIDGIEFMRVIRDGSPNQYMVLVKFKNQKLADEYYKMYNNTTFNSIESDVCHLVYVGRVEMLKDSENACMPVPGMTELPNCPVCLERMDESVDGILTILCNHAFHIECLQRWGDTSCPVCRYYQTPEEVAENRCMSCGSQESLWICLICGNIGCGRYVGLHAFRHFQETQHTYAMELGNNKVWDYVGDNYVHRLVQNKSDGKLVRVDEGGNPVQDEKLDSLNLEYTYLLTNQLESQRLYFEEKIDAVEMTFIAKVKILEEENEALTEKCFKLTQNLNDANKDRQLAEKKAAHLHSRLKTVLHDLQEEREINKSLLENQSVWQKRVATLETQIQDFTASKDKELGELKEQLRDVMFYVEAQQKLQSAVGVSQEELQTGEVIVGAAASSQSNARKTRTKKR